MLNVIVLWVALSCLASPLIGMVLAKRLRGISSAKQRQSDTARRSGSRTSGFTQAARRRAEKQSKDAAARQP
jgi:hypothetical protein